MPADRGGTAAAACCRCRSLVGKGSVAGRERSWARASQHVPAPAAGHARAPHVPPPQGQAMAAPGPAGASSFTPVVRPGSSGSQARLGKRSPPANGRPPPKVPPAAPENQAIPVRHRWERGYPGRPGRDSGPSRPAGPGDEGREVAVACPVAGQQHQFEAIGRTTCYR